MPTRYIRPSNATNPLEPREDVVQDPSQTKRTTQIIHDAQIYERTEERYAKAIETFGVECYLYRRLVQGRRCSCMAHDHVAGDRCAACYGVGIVGGYSQYGHEKYVLDSTAPSLVLSGMEIWDDKEYAHIKPTPIVLEQATKGFIESGETVHINGALQYDGFRIYSRTPAEFGGVVTPYFWNPTTSAWVELATFQAYLDSLGPAPWTLETRFRVDVENYSPEGRMEVSFYALHVKWKTGKDIVKVEQASYSDITKKLTDMGFVNASSGIRYTCNPRPQILDTDFLVKRGTGERIKVTEVKRGDPGDRALWQDLSIRPIQQNETFYEVF